MRAGFRARKRFGQNFLHDAGVLQRIAGFIQPRPEDRFIEIGPGTGALTAHLLAAGAQLIAIELDRDLLPALHERFAGAPRLTLIEGDALTADYAAFAREGPVRLAGNLPYNIATPLIFRLLALGARVRDMHFLVQREVADRLVASPGSKAYGRLSVMAQYRCHMERLLTVGPGAFQPPPKVQSTLIRVVPDPHARQARDEQLLERLVRQAFGARRKTLRNALRDMAETGAFAAVGIDPGARPENLSVDDYIALADHLADGP